jgi:hypothetical protein
MSGVPYDGEQLLLDGRLSVVWGMMLSSSTKDLESLSSTIIKFFEQHNRHLYLIEQAITKEVQLTGKLFPFNRAPFHQLLTLALH